MYNVQCTMYNVQCTMYNVQCTMYNVNMCRVLTPVPVQEDVSRKELRYRT